MSDVNPAAPAPEPSANVTPATKPPLTEADLKAAESAAYRKAQAEFEKKRVELLQRQRAEAQQREGTVRQAAKQRLTQLGDREADDWERQLEVRQKAQAYDALQAELQTHERWQAHVKDVAEAYGLDAHDPRLQGADSAADLAQKAKAAMAEEARKERERALAEAEAAAKAKLQARVDAGELDTLDSGGTAPPAGLEEQFIKEMLAARGKGAAKGREIRKKFRDKGLNVDTISLR